MQKACENFREIVYSFFKEIRQRRFEAESLPEKEKRKRLLFINFDEVPVSQDLTSEKTYHPKG
jgi:hypothetical protein